jgi:hypothetical protein
MLGAPSLCSARTHHKSHITFLVGFSRIYFDGARPKGPLRKESPAWNGKTGLAGGFGLALIGFKMGLIGFVFLGTDTLSLAFLQKNWLCFAI